MVGPKRVILIILLLCLPLLIIIIPSAFNNKVKLSAVSFLEPALKAGTFVRVKLGKSFRGLESFDSLINERDVLKKKAAELSKELTELKEASIENERLRGLLSFKKAGSYKLIPAQVIGRDSTNWYRTIIINKGTNQGVGKDMPVVLPEGLVGKVIQADKDLSQVMLMIDPNLKVSSLVQLSREAGIVEGCGRTGLSKMKYLSPQTIAQPGDIVISSGLGGIYPKGIIIGRIKKIERDSGGLYSYAWIEPAVNFSKLEEVLCLVKKPSPLF